MSKLLLPKGPIYTGNLLSQMFNRRYVLIELSLDIAEALADRNPTPKIIQFAIEIGLLHCTLIIIFQKVASLKLSET
jgi:hypothetical protein